MVDNEDEFINKNKRMKLINLIHNFKTTSLFIKDYESEKIENFLQEFEKENIFEKFLKNKKEKKEIQNDLDIIYNILNFYPILSNFFNDILLNNQSIFQFFFDLILNYDLNDKEKKNIENILLICKNNIPLKKIDYYSFYQNVLKIINKNIKLNQLKKIFLIWGILYSIGDNIYSNFSLLYGINLSVKIPENFTNIIYNKNNFISGITVCIHLNLDTFTKFENRVCQLINIRFQNKQNLTINLDNKLIEKSKNNYENILKIKIKLFDKIIKDDFDLKSKNMIKFYFSLIFDEEEKIEHFDDNINVFYLIIKTNIKPNENEKKTEKEKKNDKEITDLIFLNDFIGKVYSIKGIFGCNENIKNFLMNHCKNNNKFDLTNNNYFDDLIYNDYKIESKLLKFDFEPNSFKDDIGENQFLINDNFDNLKLIFNQGTFMNKFMNYNNQIKTIGGFKEFLPLFDLIIICNYEKEYDNFIIKTIFNTLNNLLKFQCNLELFYEENMFEILGLYFQNFPSFLKVNENIFENFINNIDAYYHNNEYSEINFREKFYKYFFNNLKFLNATSIIKEITQFKTNEIDYNFFLGELIFFDLSLNEEKEDKKEISKTYKVLLMMIKNILNNCKIQNKTIKIFIQNIFDLINKKISISNYLLNLLLDFLKEFNNEMFLNLLINNLLMVDKINELKKEERKLNQNKNEQEKIILINDEIKNKMINEKISSDLDILFKSKDDTIVYNGFMIIFNLLLYIDDDDDKNFFYEYLNENIFNQTNLDQNNYLTLMNKILFFLKTKLKNFQNYKKYGLTFLVNLIFKIYQKSKEEYVIKSFLLSFLLRATKNKNFFENFFYIVNQDNFIKNQNLNFNNYQDLYKNYNILNEIENESLILFYFINEFRKYLPKNETKLNEEILQFLLNNVRFIIKRQKELYYKDLLISTKINELYFNNNKLLKKSGFVIFFEFYFDYINLTEDKNNFLDEFKDLFDFLNELIEYYEKTNELKKPEENKRKKIKGRLNFITYEFLTNLKNTTNDSNVLKTIDELLIRLKNFEQKNENNNNVNNNNNNVNNNKDNKNNDNNNNNKDNKDNKNNDNNNNNKDNNNDNNKININNNSYNIIEMEDDKIEVDLKLLKSKLEEERISYEKYKNNCFYIYLVDLEKRIEMYKKTKLKLFRLNEFWVDKNSLKKNNFEKFHFRNHFTNTLIRPLLKPILIDDKFNTKENNFDEDIYKNDNSIIKINLFQNQLDNDEKKNSINKIINKMIDFENLDKYENNIYRCCLIKEQRHINGFLTIDKGEGNFIKFIPLRELKILSCFGIEYSNKCSLLFDIENYNDLIKIKKIIISDIIFIFLRNYFYKDSAIEIITKNGKGYYFNFLDKKKEFLSKIIENMLPILVKKFTNIIGYFNKFYLQNNVIFNTNKEVYFNDIINLWSEYKISNSYFLMITNYFSNRSFFDITQYPIFPLLYSKDDTIRDLSIPVRKEKINEINNFDDINNSYYLNYESVKNDFVKIYPFFLYKLKFDSRKSYINNSNIVYNNDNPFQNNINNNINNEILKELTISNVYEFIPEYFYLPEILLTNNKFLYGNNSIVNKNEFVINNSELLESEKVSLNLENWLNLIFGMHQKNKKKNININFDYSFDTTTSTINDIDEKIRKGLFPLKIFGDEKVKKKGNFKSKYIMSLEKKIKKNIIKLKKLSTLPFFLMRCDNLFQQFFILINENIIIVYKPENGFFDSSMIKFINYSNHNIERFNFTKLSEEIFPNYFITQNHIAISKNNNYIFLGGQFNGNIIFFNFYSNYEPIIIKLEEKGVFTALELIEVYHNFLLCGNHLGNLYVYRINEENINNYNFNLYNKKENLNKIFRETYTKKENGDDLLKLENTIYLCFDEINHINYNEELNLFTVASKDGFVHLLTFPQLKIVQTINLETPVNYAFIVNKPIPLIIVYCNEKKLLKSFSVNGKLIAIKDNINCNSPKIYGDIYNKGGIIFQDSKNSIKCLKFPYFTQLFKDSDTFTFDCDISCIELSKDCTSIYGIDINSQKIEYIYKS